MTTGTGFTVGTGRDVVVCGGGAGDGTCPDGCAGAACAGTEGGVAADGAFFVAAAGSFDAVSGIISQPMTASASTAMSATAVHVPGVTERRVG